MHRCSSSFTIEDHATGARFLESISARYRVRRETPSPSVRTYFDTFDWRLFRKGFRFTSSPGVNGQTIRLNSTDGATVHRLEAETTPVFAGEFPPGPLRDSASGMIDPRRLLALVEVESSIETLAVLDVEDKTVVRISLECGVARQPGESAVSRPISPIVRVHPVRGYTTVHDELIGFLKQELGPGDSGALTSALASLGRQADDYSSRPSLTLDPGQPANRALRRILATLLRTLLANEQGTRADLDSEFLHDFRVAVRRTRSCLGQLDGVFPPEQAARFSAEFRWLGQVTGPTRDLDVYLLKLPDYLRGFDQQTLSALDRLAETLRRKQREEQRKLVQALDSKRFRELVESWRCHLEGDDEETDETPNAARPIRELASERIDRCCRRVLKRGRKIREDSADERLHRLRIECKKLRYLLEFFHSLYDPADLGPVVRTLKRLQDNLGDFNDLEVHERALGQLAMEMTSGGEAPAETLLAMGRLAARLERRRQKERARFRKLFAGFAAAECRGRIERMLRAPGPEKS